jgi:serine/threonine protein kinase
MEEAATPQQLKNYLFLEEIGAGGFAKVFKVMNLQNKRTYACKVLSKQCLRDQLNPQQFQREINTMAYLSHENLVKCYDLLWDENNFYQILDYCPGGSLFQYIASNGALSEPIASLIFQQIVSAVQYCHERGVAHRDLKPENILINRFPRIKVTDFGLCGFIAPTRLMKTFCGSPIYAAPECLSMVQYDGRKSDVWSLGVILYVLVTGQVPWEGSNTSKMIRQILVADYKVPQSISPQVRELITGILNADPNRRMRIETLLGHPWLKNGSLNGISSLSSLSVLSVKKVAPMLMAEISDDSNHFSESSEDGVFSPFGHSDDEDQMPPLIALGTVRCGSEDRFAHLGTTNRNQARRRFRPIKGVPRQRSSTNLLKGRHMEPSLTQVLGEGEGAKQWECIIMPIAEEGGA